MEKTIFVIPGSQAEKTILRILEDRDILLPSKPIIDEVLSELSVKFSRDREAVSRAAVCLAESGQSREAHRFFLHTEYSGTAIANSGSKRRPRKPLFAFL